MGLAWPKYRGGLLAHSHWRQSQERCCPGSVFLRAAAAEDGGAVASLCEVFAHTCTSADGTWETARAQTRGVEFTGSVRTTPQNTLWPPPETIARPFNSEAHGLTVSYLPDIPPQIRSSVLQRPLRGITRPSTPPHVVAQRDPGCNRSSGAVLEGHRAFCFLQEAAVSVEAASLGHAAECGRLQKMQSEAPTCSCNGRSPTPKFV